MYVSSHEPPGVRAVGVMDMANLQRIFECAKGKRKKVVRFWYFSALEYAEGFCPCGRYSLNTREVRGDKGRWMSDWGGGLVIE